MKKKRSSNKEFPFIRPLFTSKLQHMTVEQPLLEFNADDYNKSSGPYLINATNDTEAISAFLNEYRDSPLTFQAYAKEIERLLLWCIHIGKINISSLRRNHLADYQLFLKHPLPEQQWCGLKTARQKKDGALNPNWRPFGSNGLSAISLNKSITILDSFFNYLVQVNYLIGNPLAVEKRRKKKNRAQVKIVDRYLELDEIRATLSALEEHACDTFDQQFYVVRAQYIILLLFYTGLRITESASHCMGDFTQREGNWFLRVVGKGKKQRDIPAPDELLNALAEFRNSVGLPTKEPQYQESTPLIPMENLVQSITPRRINQILKWAFRLGANRLKSSFPRKASKLRSASAHWLRHSYVTYLLNSGAPLKVAQENAGHSDVGTTMRYRHVSQVDRHTSTRSLSIKIDSTS